MRLDWERAADRLLGLAAIRNAAAAASVGFMRGALRMSPHALYQVSDVIFQSIRWRGPNRPSVREAERRVAGYSDDTGIRAAPSR